MSMISPMIKKKIGPDARVIMIAPAKFPKIYEAM